MPLNTAPFNWRCPFCNNTSTIIEKEVNTVSTLFKHHQKGNMLAFLQTIHCSNPECKEHSLYAELYTAKLVGGYFDKDTHERSWSLLPASQAKTLPDYIPEAIKADYKEAYLIKDLSPKASATLSRRCLQGIIRDFWEIKKDNLYQEIEALKGKIDPLTWEAIDSVRSLGNIGAHMEKNINIVVDVEPEEAGLLLELIETLINEWYINRHEREKRLQSIIKMKEDKKPQKNGN